MSRRSLCAGNLGKKKLKSGARNPACGQNLAHLNLVKTRASVALKLLCFLVSGWDSGYPGASLMARAALNGHARCTATVPVRSSARGRRLTFYTFLHFRVNQFLLRSSQERTLPHNLATFRAALRLRLQQIAAAVNTDALTPTERNHDFESHHHPTLLAAGRRAHFCRTTTLDGLSSFPNTASAGRTHAAAADPPPAARSLIWALV